MITVHAIFEKGVFRPTQSVDLPESSEVVFEPRPVGSPIPPVPPVFISDPRPSPEEFRRILDAMAARPSGKILPLDFSREDIYDDHD